MTLRGQYECEELTVKFTFGTAACSLAPCFQAHVHPRVAARSMRISILQTPSRTNLMRRESSRGTLYIASQPKPSVPRLPRYQGNHFRKVDFPKQLCFLRTLALRARRPKDPDYDISQTQTHGESDDPLDDLKLHMLPFSASFKPDSSSMLYVLGLL